MRRFDNRFVRATRGGNILCIEKWGVRTRVSTPGLPVECVEALHEKVSELERHVNYLKSEKVSFGKGLR